MTVHVLNHRDAEGGGSVDGCVFDSPGGNGLLVEGRTVGMRITENEFKWVGDSAIVVG
jgi:hypothetical protein